LAGLDLAVPSLVGFVPAINTVFSAIPAAEDPVFYLFVRAWQEEKTNGKWHSKPKQKSFPPGKVFSNLLNTV